MGLGDLAQPDHRVRFRHWLHPDRNPLRRRGDRIEALCVLLLAVIFILAAPMAAWQTGQAAYRDGMQTEREQHAARQQVQAVVLEDPGAGGTGTDVAGVPHVRARWTDPDDGSRRTGLVPLTTNADTGDRIPVWIDRDGQPTQPPQDRGQTVASAVMMATIAVILIGGGLLAIRLLIGRVMDRRRLAAWAAEWRRTEPQWTRWPHRGPA